MAQFEPDSQVNLETKLAEMAPASFDIFASARFATETQRVLYALAMPEYKEAWLQLPEVERIECHADGRAFDRFRIDMFHFGVRQESIFGSCLLSKPNRITYVWEKTYAGGQAKSIVEMRLWGGPHRCTLNLRHGRFHDREESEWHSRMWRRSLCNLCRLMEGKKPAS